MALAFCGVGHSFCSVNMLVTHFNASQAYRATKEFDLLPEKFTFYGLKL